MISYDRGTLLQIREKNFHAMAPMELFKEDILALEIVQM